jgi:glucan phosphorylase
MASAACAWAISPSSARTINGVSALHTELMKETVFADLHSSIPTASTTRPTASRRAAG